jgi:hypothetical protein
MNYFIESRRKGVSYPNWIGHILRRNCLLKHIIKRKIEGGIKVIGDKEEDVSSYWMILRERMDTGD